jgi:transcriptional regulator with XRE-family HTH domain
MKITEYKALRESLNLTQQQVADELKTNVQVISQIERGVKERMTKRSWIQEDYKRYIDKEIKKLRKAVDL